MRRRGMAHSRCVVFLDFVCADCLALYSDIPRSWLLYRLDMYPLDGLVCIASALGCRHFWAGLGWVGLATGQPGNITTV